MVTIVAKTNPLFRLRRFVMNTKAQLTFPWKKVTVYWSLPPQCAAALKEEKWRAHMNADARRFSFSFYSIPIRQQRIIHQLFFSKISPSLISPSKNGKRNGLEYTRLGQKYFQKFHQTLTSESGRRPLPRNFGFETNCSTWNPETSEFPRKKQILLLKTRAHRAEKRFGYCPSLSTPPMTSSRDNVCRAIVV